MHKKCQKCLQIRQFIFAFSCAVLIALLGDQLGLSAEVSVWLSFSGAVAVLALSGVRGRRNGQK